MFEGTLKLAGLFFPWLVNLIPSIDILPLGMLLVGAVLIVIGLASVLPSLLHHESRTI